MTSQHQRTAAAALRWAGVVGLLSMWSCAAVDVRDTTRKATRCEGIPVSAGADLDGAVDEAPLGATLCLEPGTYGRVVIEKSVTIAAADAGAGPVILDARGEGEVVVISGPGIEVGLRGLMILGGAGEEVGGGLFIEGDAHVAIQRCVISGNVGGTSGGAALYVSGATVRIDQTRIVGNRSGVGSSVALLEETAEVTLRATLIAENEDTTGASIRVLSGSLLNVYGSTLAHNRSPHLFELSRHRAAPAVVRVNGSILSHTAGPFSAPVEGGLGSSARLRESVVHGDASGWLSVQNRAGDPQLDRAYRPGRGSIARGMLKRLPASWATHDLLGHTRGIHPTVGAID